MRDRLTALMITAAMMVLLSACDTAPTTATGQPTTTPGVPKPTLPPRPRQIDGAATARTSRVRTSGTR